MLMFLLLRLRAASLFPRFCIASARLKEISNGMV